MPEQSDRPQAPVPTSLAELLRDRPPMARALPSFEPDRAPAEPATLFLAWLAEAVAADVPDPQIVTLATVDADGLPDARALVLREVDVPDAGWLFAADARSPKGRQLAAHPYAALTVYWPQLGRQVRIRGPVGTADPADAAAEFRTRSPAARTAILVGHQSEPLGSPADYRAAAGRAAALLAAHPDTVAATHTLYALRAREVEFWQGAADRYHVRLRYRRATVPTWERTLLWP
ncbi:pyridoxal 5'-phosphate synthase [Kitasatospora sp. NPDC052896]|uniref:pyridoxal 5'-phosphate synthase n=1 Tax=Kitasatospora sp. NPDC052896 TaxID=3364061 RepID=UPI0037C6449D